MSAKLETLSQTLQSCFGDKLESVVVALGEVTIQVSAASYLEVMQTLRDEPSLKFEELIDLCGVDYSTHAAHGDESRRFAAVTHLLSIAHNWRLRVRALAADNDFPVLDSVCGIWASANWYEREAFDLYGIVFSGHEDLRRILTDYGFVGHPFRKDFPVSGYVEMRYDPDQARVIYQPLTIEPRENTPRIVRENTYGGAGHG